MFFRDFLCRSSELYVSCTIPNPRVRALHTILYRRAQCYIQITEINPHSFIADLITIVLYSDRPTVNNVLIIFGCGVLTILIIKSCHLKKLQLTVRDIHIYKRKHLCMPILFTIVQLLIVEFVNTLVGFAFLS